MKRPRLDQDIKPLSEFQADAVGGLLEELETLRDLHLAERQLAAGQGIAHDVAREQILSRLDR